MTRLSALDRNAALILIDLQRAIDHPDWGERNNPDAEMNVTLLLVAWRASGRPIYHIRHDSTEPQSHYRPGQPGHDFKPEAQPLGDEPAIAKKTNSAFIGTDLEARLRAARQNVLIVAGVITNNSVEARFAWRETSASRRIWWKTRHSPSDVKIGTAPRGRPPKSTP